MILFLNDFPFKFYVHILLSFCKNWSSFNNNYFFGACRICLILLLPKLSKVCISRKVIMSPPFSHIILLIFNLKELKQSSHVIFFIVVFCYWWKSFICKIVLLFLQMPAFNHLRIRIGGSLQDRVLYDVGSLKTPCHPFQKMKDGMFGFSMGCLHMNRWDELNKFFNATG